VTQEGQDSQWSPPIRLVRLWPQDAGEVLTLQRAGYITEAQLHDELNLPPLRQSVDEVREELANPAVTALGLRAGHRLVGAVRLRDLGGGQVDLGRLVVAPDQQRLGLGSRLLVAAESALPGTRRIHLFTGERSEANLRLYRRLGYVETHRTPAGGHELVHLTKELDVGRRAPHVPAAGRPDEPGRVAASAFTVSREAAMPDEVGRLLAALPGWFGMEESNAQYVQEARSMTTYVARATSGDVGVAGPVLGILLLARHFAATAEVHLLAVDPAWHRRGVGRALVEAAADAAARDGARLLEVKTRGPSRPDEGYHGTRAFCRALDFLPLEELADLWPDNPCLVMVRLL
jgi:GNAT superfamily N-acetyltransferase